MLTKSQVKYIQSLGHKKFRDQEGVFIAEGPRIVEEWLRQKELPVQVIYAVKEWCDRHPGVEVTQISEQELSRISQMQQPKEVLAVIKKFQELSDLPATNNWILALDTIQDPGNMGTIIRIADWFGIENIVCQPDSADIYNPKVVQAAMGSLARVRVLYTPLEEWLKKNSSLRVYAASLEGISIHQMEESKKGVLIIGNEGKGISDAVMKHVNVKLTIPGKGGAESLNAAVATGILLSHLTN